MAIKPLSGVEHTRTFEIPDDYTQLEISYAINVDYSSETSVMTVTAEHILVARKNSQEAFQELRIYIIAEIADVMSG